MRRIIIIILMLYTVQGYCLKRYAMPGPANWSWTATNQLYWSANTNCTGGGATVPGINDTVYFACAGSRTITLGVSISVKMIDFTGFTGTFATGTYTVAIGGSFIAAPSMTFTGTGPVTLTGTGVHTLDTKGLLLFRHLTITATTGTYNLGSDLNLGTVGQTLQINSGTFNTNNYNIQTGLFLSSNSSVRAINLGSSTITISRQMATVLNFSTTTNLTFAAGTSTIVFSGAMAGNVTVYFGTIRWNEVKITTPNINYAYTITANKINELFVSAGVYVKIAGTISIPDSLVLSGTSLSHVIISTSTGNSYLNSANMIGCNSDYVENGTVALAGVSFSGLGSGYLGANSISVNSNNGWVYAACGGGGSVTTIKKVSRVSAVNIAKISSISNSQIKKINGVVNN